MKLWSQSMGERLWRLSLWLWLAALLCGRARGAEVTLITHGWNGNVNGWVTGMANWIPQYARFPGTNFTIYQINLTTDGTNYFYQWSRTNGVAPTNTDTGEIIVKLDWSQMAGTLFSAGISTYTVASVASYVLTNANAISELNGHALAEFPMHFIGHSRGGSLITEMSRLLGTNGIWVDQVTTLDPHPLNNDGFNDSIIGSVVDATAKLTYANVLYADNYWQDMGMNIFNPNGEAVAGSYTRQLTTLSPGYSGAGATHSDVHLWYHGTIDWQTPASDTEASITATGRTTEWTTYEQQGTNAGFLYSLIGGGNRLSTDQPLGMGLNPEIRDGFNQWWDLGAGTSSNRTALTTNTGQWPNLMRFDRLDTNTVAQGGSTLARFYYQWARPASNTATVGFYLDSDFNPLNGNDRLLLQTNVPGNGATNVSFASVSLTLAASNAPPGRYALYAKISGGGLTRYLYAPETVTVITSQQRPVLDITRMSGGAVVVGVNGVSGQTIILQESADLKNWVPVRTNLLAGTRWTYTNSLSGGMPEYFQAVLGP